MGLGGLWGEGVGADADRDTGARRIQGRHSASRGVDRIGDGGADIGAGFDIGAVDVAREFGRLDQ